MVHHIRNAVKFGVPIVVAINKFHTDTPAEIALVQAKAMEAGATAAVMANHWAQGGAGALDLAKAVMKSCSEVTPKLSKFSFLYPLDLTLVEKIELVAKEIYGAASIELSDVAKEQLETYEQQGYGKLPVCMAKTHLSLSTDPKLKGVPTGFVVAVREVRASVGAGFIYPILGKIMTIPGLPTKPGFYNIDLKPDGKWSSFVLYMAKRMV